MNFVVSVAILNGGRPTRIELRTYGTSLYNRSHTVLLAWPSEMPAAAYFDFARRAIEPSFLACILRLATAFHSIVSSPNFSPDRSTAMLVRIARSNGCCNINRMQTIQSLYVCACTVPDDDTTLLFARGSTIGCKWNARFNT